MKKFTNIKKDINKKNKVNEALLSESDLRNMANDMRFIDDEVKDKDKPVVGNEGSDVIKFFSKLFESKEMAHIYHLQSRTLNNGDAYSQHLILGDYYESIIEQIDELIEVYQGQYGLVDGYEIIDTAKTNKMDCLDYFEDLAECIKHCRQSISNEDSHLHSIIDIIVAIVYRTIYKLKFLSKSGNA